MTRSQKSAGSPCHEKIEFGLDRLVWFLDDLHFIKLPLACMGHSAGGDPRLVAGYKILKPFDLCLLALISPLFLGLLDLVHPFEIFIITGISGEIASVQIIYDIDH